MIGIFAMEMLRPIRTRLEKVGVGGGTGGIQDFWSYICHMICIYTESSSLTVVENKKRVRMPSFALPPLS